MDNETPAAKAIRLIGVKEIAYACDLTTDAVYKWANLGGGFIPAKHQACVLRLARDRSAPLTAEDVIGAAA